MRRTTILILMNLILLCAVFGFILYFWFFSQQSYDTIERNTINATQGYLENGIADQQQQIISHLSDYATWDDSYRFVLGEYPGYPEDNFNNVTFHNLNIHQITVLSLNNTPVFQAGSDPGSDQVFERNIPPSLLSLLTPASENGTITVLGVINDTPFLFSGAPILYSNGSGPARGTMIFGRQMDKTFLDALERSLHYPVTVTTGPGSYADLPSVARFPNLIPAITSETSDRIENSFTTLSSDQRYLITFKIDRPKVVAIMGRQIIADSFSFLIIIAGAYACVMTLILLSAFSQYEQTQNELEATRQEVSLHSERKQISEKIRMILDTFLAFGPDAHENIQRLVLLTGVLLNADCVVYSQIRGGESRIIASTGLPPGFSPDPDPEGKISTYLARINIPGTCFFTRVSGTGFDETDPLIRTGHYRTYHGCLVFPGRDQPGSLSVYYQESHEPGEMDQVIMDLISNAIAVEENRGDVQIVLLRRDRILDAVSAAAAILMRQEGSPDFSMILRMFGEQLGISRVYIDEYEPGKGTILPSISRPWTSGSVLDGSSLITGVQDWKERLSNLLPRLREGMVVAGPVDSFQKQEQEFIAPLGIKSIAICPIFRRTKLVAFLILEDHERCRDWIQPECEALMAAAALIGSTLEQKENEFLNQRYTHQLAEKSHELALMNIDLQERSTQVENLLKRKQEMIIQIGHDLRTPLTPIIGLLPFLKDQETDPKKLELFNHIEEGATRIRLLLDRILLLQQMNTTLSDEKWGGTDLASLTNTVLERYRDQIEKKDIRVTNDIPGLLYARIPDKSLYLVIEEITRNAIHYSGKGGVISFSGGRQQDRTWFCVADNGNGLTDTDKERIFDYFYKSDLSRHEIDTHGLGLSIVKHILEKYQGTITVESEGTGKGSRFSISLPVIKTGNP